jgi:hypothetical protein
MRLDLRSVMAAACCAALMLQACSALEAQPPRWKYSSNPTTEQVRGALRQAPAQERLETFLTRAEFDYYVRKTREVKRRHGLAWYEDVDAQPADELDEVHITGTRISAPQSITNNQTAGVDEGDIVKSWGRFLIVLHDARLFSVDLGESAGKLRLADRVDAYQDSDTDAWYDELLIQGNHVLVTGYSYDAGQSELSVFEIGQDGRLSLQSRFFIKADDYFSDSNYASRLVGGKLLLYTTIDLEADRMADPVSFPQWRRWSPREGFTAWKPLLEPSDIYRPVDPTLNPVVHVISECAILPGKYGQCESRGVVAARPRELYVTPDAAYLWNVPENVGDHLWSGPDECVEGTNTASLKPRPATVFRLGFEDNAMTAVRAHGRPPDQFALHSRSNRFHALVRRIPDGCWLRAETALELLTFSERDFSDLPAPYLASHARAMPSVGGGFISARYSDKYLAYGAGGGWWRVWNDRRDEEPALPRSLVTVPLQHPDRLQKLDMPHSIERVELLGENIVSFGVTDDREFGITTLDLRRAPQMTDLLRIAATRESDGRSHAFSALVHDDGSAVLGLPTMVGVGKKDKYGYDETEDRLQFLTADRNLKLRLAGAITGDQLPENPAYSCEVSCVDWYGNTRPIFYRDRLFALMGREFVEGELVGDQVREIARLDLTRTAGHQSR